MAKQQPKQSKQDVLKKEFADKVKELKKDKTKEELLEIVSKQPENHELRDFLAARQALDELKIPYNKSFK